jgi:cytochrome c biogenesis protein CcmG, thiol:disulfide interchange protein DsbE
MKRKAWIVTLSAVAISLALLFVLYAGFGSDPHAVPFLLAGKPAPPFTLQTLDGGKAISLEQLRGRPVVLNFWASWCGPCKYEHRAISEGAEQFGSQAQFLGIIFEDTEDNAREFLQEMGPTPFPQLVDPRSRTSVDYGVSGVPETYFITADGTILTKHVGPIDPQTLAQRIQELTASAGASKPTARQ